MSSKSLGHFVASVGHVKKTTLEIMTTVQTMFKRTELFSGVSKTHEPRTETDLQQPPEVKNVEQNVGEQLNRVKKAMVDHLAMQLTIDCGNQVGIVAIPLDNEEIKTPVATLMFISRMLDNLLSVANNIPELPMNQTWTRHGDQYRSTPTSRYSTQKRKVHTTVVAPTEHHPAQVITSDEDVVSGTWTTINTSTAMPYADKVRLLDFLKSEKTRIGGLLAQANATEKIELQKAAAEKYVNWLFSQVN